MTRVDIWSDDGMYHTYKLFPFRIQAKTWLMLNGFIFEEDYVYKHRDLNRAASLNSRGM